MARKFVTGLFTLLALAACSTVEVPGTGKSGDPDAANTAPTSQLPGLPFGKEPEAPPADTKPFTFAPPPDHSIFSGRPRSWAPEYENARPASVPAGAYYIQGPATAGSGSNPNGGTANPSAGPTAAPGTTIIETRYELPAIGTEAFAAMVKDTPLATILALLEEKAKQDDDFRTKTVLAGALVGDATAQQGTKSDAWLKADRLTARMKIRPDIDQQWLRLQRAQIESLAGMDKDALQEISLAYDEAVRRVEPEITTIYFCTGGTEMDENGFDKPRRRPDGTPNDVYGAKDTIYVAYQFRYFTGVRAGDSDRYGYKLEASAELFDDAETDPKKARVQNFQWGPKPAELKRGRPPDELECGRWAFTLPWDIKANRDYTLRITFKDMQKDGNKGVALAPKDITIKVR